ncbi:hypothetical protein STEG23_014460, partial [Scotinomys teguina]
TVRINTHRVRSRTLLSRNVLNKNQTNLYANRDKANGQENHQQFPEATGWLRLPSTQSGFALAVDLLNGTTYQKSTLLMITVHEAKFGNYGGQTK